MNHLNQLEKQLESWTPRRPSEKLKQRLFPAAPTQEREPGMAAWSRLAPALCLAMLITVVGATQHDRAGFLAVADSSNVLASMSSFCATNTRSVRMNACQVPDAVVTFDWTSGVRSLSTTGSFPLWKTNLQKL